MGRRFDPDAVLERVRAAASAVEAGSAGAAADLAAAVRDLDANMSRGAGLPGVWQRDRAVPEALQMGLFDPVEGVETRAVQVGPGRAELDAKAEQAQRQVEANMDPLFEAEARRLVLVLCLTRSEWTADDVWDGLAASPNVVSTHENRGMGPVVKGAGRAGWARASNRWVKSRRRQGGDARVWESLVWVPEGGAEPAATGGAVLAAREWLRASRVPGRELRQWGLSSVLLAELDRAGLLDGTVGP